jgi:hypothetical protein
MEGGGAWAMPVQHKERGGGREGAPCASLNKIPLDRIINDIEM